MGIKFFCPKCGKALKGQHDKQSGTSIAYPGAPYYQTVNYNHERCNYRLAVRELVKS